MKLSRNKISKLLKVNNQSRKAYKKNKRQRKRGKSFRKKKPFNIKHKSMKRKKLKGGDVNQPPVSTLVKAGNDRREAISESEPNEAVKPLDETIQSELNENLKEMRLAEQASTEEREKMMEEQKQERERREAEKKQADREKWDSRKQMLSSAASSAYNMGSSAAASAYNMGKSAASSVTKGLSAISNYTGTSLKELVKIARDNSTIVYSSIITLSDKLSMQISSLNFDSFDQPESLNTLREQINDILSIITSINNTIAENISSITLDTAEIEGYNTEVSSLLSALTKQLNTTLEQLSMQPIPDMSGVKGILEGMVNEAQSAIASLSQSIYKNIFEQFLEYDRRIGRKGTYLTLSDIQSIIQQNPAPTSLDVTDATIVIPDTIDPVLPSPPKSLPGESPGQSPGQSSTPDSMPGSRPDSTPDSTPDSRSDSRPGSTSGSVSGQGAQIKFPGSGQGNVNVNSVNNPDGTIEYRIHIVYPSANSLASATGGDENTINPLVAGVIGQINGLNLQQLEQEENTLNADIAKIQSVIDQIPDDLSSKDISELERLMDLNVQSGGASSDELIASITDKKEKLNSTLQEKKQRLSQVKTKIDELKKRQSNQPASQNTAPATSTVPATSNEAAASTVPTTSSAPAKSNAPAPSNEAAVSDNDPAASTVPDMSNAPATSSAPGVSDNESSTTNDPPTDDTSNCDPSIELNERLLTKLKQQKPDIDSISPTDINDCLGAEQEAELTDIISLDDMREISPSELVFLPDTMASESGKFQCISKKSIKDLQDRAPGECIKHPITRELFGGRRRNRTFKKRKNKRKKKRKRSIKY